VLQPLVLTVNDEEQVVPVAASTAGFDGSSLSFKMAKLDSSETLMVVLTVVSADGSEDGVAVAVPQNGGSGGHLRTPRDISNGLSRPSLRLTRWRAAGSLRGPIFEVNRGAYSSDQPAGEGLGGTAVDPRTGCARGAGGRLRRLALGTALLR
jgi:hypothetical protein